MLYRAVLCLAALTCPSLCDPMDCSLPGTSVHGDSPGKNIGAGCHALLQGIFPTQGLNPGLPHCRRILNHLSHQGSPRILEWVAYSFSRGEIPHSGIEPGSPALQADSLPAELPGKPPVLYSRSVLVFYFVYSSMYMSVPVSQFISSVFPLVTINSISTSVTLLRGFF